MEASRTPAPEPGDRRRIGETFVELGFVTSEQLETALARQRVHGGRIGEILIEQGAMDRFDLASALSEHWEPNRAAPAVRPVSLAGAGQEQRPSQHESVLAELVQRIDELESVRRADALALGVRLRSLESALADLERRLEA